MGGYSAIAEGLGKVAESAFGEKAGAAVEKGGYRGVFSEARSYAQHPYANKIYDDYQKVYKPTVEKASSQIGVASQKAGVAKSQAMISQEAHKIASDTTFGKNQVRLQTMLNMAKRDKG